MPYTPTQQLTADVLAWPGTSVRLGDRGEYGFDAHGHELGHLHGDRVAHFFFDRRLGAELHEAGRVGPHPVAPKSVKLGARPIESDDDVADIRAMLRLNYERPVRKVIEQLDRASDDPDAFAALLTEQATIVNFIGLRVVGRDAFHALMTESMATGLAAVKTDLTLESVEFASESVAIARATKRVSDSRPHADDDPLPSSVGTMTITLVRQPDGAWLIAAIQTTPLLAVPTAQRAAA